MLYVDCHINRQTTVNLRHFGPYSVITVYSSQTAHDYVNIFVSSRDIAIDVADLLKKDAEGQRAKILTNDNGQ